MPLDLEDRLTWAGLRSNNARGIAAIGFIDKLKREIGAYSDFVDDLSGLSSYSDFQSYLETTANFSTDEATQFISNIQQEFASWSDFKSFATGATSWAEFIAGFGTEAGPSDVADAGIRVLPGGGVTFDGVETNVTTTEVYGERIEFSQKSTSFGTAVFSYTNFQVSNTTPISGTPVTISIDIDETAGNPGSATAVLLEDDEVAAVKTVTLAANGSETVEFNVLKPLGCYDYSIAGNGPTRVCWNPINILP